MQGTANVLKRALIIPDCHRPFHSRRGYALMLEAAQLLEVDEIVILGDYADFYSVSRYGKHPKVSTLLSDEVDSVREGLDELDRLFPQAKKVFLEGNHEARLEIYLVEKAPGLFGVTDCQYLFEINRRPLWTYIPFGRDQRYRVLDTDLYAFHRPKGPNPRAHLQRTMVSSIYGDIHKIEEARAVSLDGRIITASCPGWLGDVTSRVFDYMPSTPQWQLGFSVVTKVEPSGEFYIETFEIKNNQVVVHGQVLK